MFPISFRLLLMPLFFAYSLVKILLEEAFQKLKSVKISLRKRIWITLKCVCQQSFSTHKKASRNVTKFGQFEFKRRFLVEKIGCHAYLIWQCPLENQGSEAQASFDHWLPGRGIFFSLVKKADKCTPTNNDSSCKKQSQWCRISFPGAEMRFKIGFRCFVSETTFQEKIPLSFPYFFFIIFCVSPVL